jgi:hypothetical protein
MAATAVCIVKSLAGKNKQLRGTLIFLCSDLAMCGVPCNARALIEPDRGTVH